MMEHNLNKVIDIADTWYIYLASGDISRAFDYGKKLPYIAFRRFDEKFRIMEYERARRLLWAMKSR
jgi:hypothetical protein